VNLAEGFASFDEQWSPRLAGELRIELRDESNVVLEEGEFVVVTRGVEHRPVAGAEAEIGLFEPRETLRAGTIHPRVRPV